MIAIAIILTLTAATIAGLAMFWRKLVEWIKKAVDKIQEVYGVLAEKTSTFIMRTREGLKRKAKLYSRNKVTHEWEETVFTKSVSESEVPAEILAKAYKQEMDVEVSITEELRYEIGA